MNDYRLQVLKVTTAIIDASVAAIVERRKIVPRRATAYIAPDMVVRATLRGRCTRRHIEMILSITKPNHRERVFIRQCQKVGEPFPVKRVQYQFVPKRA